MSIERTTETATVGHYKGKYINLDYNFVHYIATIWQSEQLAKVIPGIDFRMNWYQYPNGNCQVSSLAYFNSIISKLLDLGDFDSRMTKEDGIALLKGILLDLYYVLNYEMGYNLKQVILDVYSTHVPYIKEVLYEFPIKVEGSYVSTNQTEMHLVLIDFSKMKELWEKTVDISKDFTLNGNNIVKSSSELIMTPQ